MEIQKIKKIATAFVITFALMGLISLLFIAPIPYIRDQQWEAQPTALGLVEMIGYIVCSLSVYALLFLILKAVLSGPNDTLFKDNFAKPAFLGGKILFCGSLAFEILFIIALIVRIVSKNLFDGSNVYMAIVNELGFELACVLIGLIGLAISVALVLFGKTLRKGEEYKEDSEAIV